MNLKVIGLTQSGLENARSRIATTTFGFPDLPEQEADTLLIRPFQLVGRFFFSLPSLSRDFAYRHAAPPSKTRWRILPSLSSV